MFEIAPEFLIDWLKANLPWFVPVVLFLHLLRYWGKQNWEAINGREKKPDSYAWVIKQLKENSWGKLYLDALGWVMDKVSDWIGDRAKLNQIYVTPANPSSVIHKTFGFNPFTPESYDKCLRLAFIYPVLSFFIAWAMGGNGQVGDFGFIGKEAATLEVWQRWLWLLGMTVVMLVSFWLIFRWQGWRQWLMLGAVLPLWSSIPSLLGKKFSETLLILSEVFGAVFLLLYLAGWLTGLLVYRSANRSHDAVYRIAFTVAFSVVFAFAFEFLGPGVFAFAFAFFGSVVLVFAFVFAVVFTFTSNEAFTVAEAIAAFGMFAFSVAVVGVIIVLLGALQQWSGNRNKFGWFWLFYTLLFMVLGYASLAYVQNSEYMVMLLFWLVLPLVNAPLDWLSLGVTRGLLQAVRAQKHGGWRTLGWGLLDLVFALGFLFLIAAVLVVATALGNVVAGKTLVDLEAIFTGLRDDPWSVNHWWVYFMLLSTLVPTLIHFALAGGAATLWLPQRLREQVADNLEQNHYKLSVAWVYLTFTPAIGFVVAPALLLGLLYWLVTTQGGWFGGHLLNWAEWLALAVNPPAVTPP